MKYDPHITPHVPRLTGLAWPQVAPYLEEFLKRLLAADDSTGAALTTLAGTGDDAAVSPRRPQAHIHPSVDVLGLDSPVRRRPPMAHLHAPQDIAGLPTDDVVSRRAPMAHTHLAADIPDFSGAVSPLIPAADVVARRAPLAHTHAKDDISGFDEGSLILAARFFGGV